MSNVVAVRVKCGKCHNYHGSSAEVRACYFPPVQPPAPQEPASASVEQSGLRGLWRGHGFATSKQIGYANDLGGLEFARRIAALSSSGARKEITKFLANRRSTPVSDSDPMNAPNRKKTKVPLQLLETLPNGYYAARQAEGYPFTFFRVSRPTKRQYAGCIKIQTQHGDKLKEVMVLWPKSSGAAERNVSVYDFTVEDNLLLVVVDPKGSGRAYAEELKRCQNCGKDLTDDRSRYYGVGPDCETRRQDIIDLVDFTKGRYRPHAAH